MEMEMTARWKKNTEGKIVASRRLRREREDKRPESGKKDGVKHGDGTQAESRRKGIDKAEDAFVEVSKGKEGRLRRLRSIFKSKRATKACDPAKLDLTV
jgi:hypothetical protein